MSYKENVLIIDKLKELIVKVHTIDERGCIIRVGTGFFVDTKHIVTANHVVSEAFDTGCSIRVLFDQSDSSRFISARVIHSNPQSDINILLVDEVVLNEEVDFIRMVQNSFRKREFSYAAYGYPISKPEGHYQTGIILDENIDVNGQPIIDLSLGEGRLNDYRGYSGSPVVCNGQLIGIAIEQSIGLDKAQSIKVLDISFAIDLFDDKWICNDSFINEILDVFYSESEKEIARNKNNGKYIPEMFVELGDMKEYLRGFSDPVLFFEKHLDYVKRHRFEQYNLLLDKYGIPRIGQIEDRTNVSLENVEDISDNMTVPLA